MNWLSQRCDSFVYANKGVITLIKEQTNAQIHALASAGVIALGFYCEISRSEW